jgi:hypothetical protein
MGLAKQPIYVRIFRKARFFISPESDPLSAKAR